MSISQKHQTVLGRSLLPGATWLLLAATAWSFQAQAADVADESLIEEVVVTGSLIKRDNFDSASPLQVLDAQDIVAEATPALGEIIYNQTFNYGSDSFSSHYSVTNPEGNRTGANFRGLGGGATLTLIDGKRALDSNLNNLIPQIAIERIDILKDGASALYGTDAVAGVINIIPLKDFEGIQMGAQYQMDSEGDHEEYVVNFVIGDTSNRGYYTLALEARERTALFQTERPQLLADSFGSSGTGNPGSYNVPIRDATGAIVGAEQLMDPGCGVAQSPGGNGQRMTGNERNNISGRPNSAGTVCRFEFGEFFNFVSPNKVLNSYLNYEYEINDQLVYFADLTYSRQKTKSRGSPTNPGGRIRDINLILGGIAGDHPGNPWRAFYDADGDGMIDDDGTELLYAQDADGDGVPDRADPVGDAVLGEVILAADPFDAAAGIPFNEDVQIAALRIFGKLGTLPSNLDETGANIGYASYDVNTFRMNQALRLTFDNGWEVTASATLQQNLDLRTRKNQSFRSILLGLQGLIGPAPGISDYRSSFRYYNPFSTSALNCVNRICTDPGAATNPDLGDYPNTQFVADAIDLNAVRTLKTKLLIYSAVATGDLLEGWAGPISGAFGVEYRHFHLDWTPRSDEQQCNNWYDACSFAYSADDEIKSAFFELALPFVDSDQFGTGEVQIAGRYTSYADIGSTFDPKVAIRWEPREWLAVRASYSTAFKAPSIWQRFAPGDSFLQSTNDLVFGDYEATYRTNTYSGNPDLQPEEAEIYNVGLSLALLDGDLNVGVDYANYFFEDRITLLRGPRVVEDDFRDFLEMFPQADESNPDRDDAVAWATQFQNPNIIRGGPPSYTIVTILGYYLNAQEMDHTALDLYANYTWNTDLVGTIRFGVQGTKILKFDYDLGGGSTGDAVGKQNLGIDVIPTLPEIRLIGTVNWSYGNHSALLRARWNESIGASWTSSEIDSLTYYDLTYNYVAEGLLGNGSTVLELGARNLLNTYPDPHIGALGGGIELSIHDPRGRMLFMRAKHEF